MAHFKAKAPKQPWQAQEAYWSTWEAKRDKLIAQDDVTSRKELRKMRDVRYSTDPEPMPGRYHNPDQRAFVKGSDGKARNILKGWNAKRSQGRGL
ncbi:hypothetical protein FBPa25_0002 [Pseudomonas phage vB_PaeP_FBPa25]|uniref:Uncharacterized protein n=2 Tax=Viruses TaxID=10239 RepID=A0A9E7QLK9_9CAUD|nr:hypothetical protein FBPa3_0001 [Pseudomonas phage vB_PaeM_FBPa3]UVN13155.1 hypothetical protein FBPa6_0001 [Pseudomonas phage vB_PaeP_FBPa6]UVN13531.1 hypothetical protein FBPa18_0002 [Pseudomonas phage vB_PaeP_FBPa18]UVN13699.1 hypothetical protein FBPa25_0002 [Pseudomonas phage vB_PaeP_FBPa25]